jgi:carboxyl-terminal processing protease
VEALGVASQFLPDGTPLFQREDADDNVDLVSTVGNRGVYLEGEMVVLIDSNSASSSEIVASAIRDAGRAPLYGETTFGVGTVLLPFELSDGSLAVLGIELLLTGAGERLFMEGVAPTEEVPLGAEQTAGFILIADDDQDNMLTEEELTSLEDDQLQAAYEAVVQPGE